MNIEAILDSLNLVYYEYDARQKIIRLKQNASNLSVIQRELTKITYYLAGKNITFDVLHNKSIIIGERETLLSRIKRYINI